MSLKSSSQQIHKVDVEVESGDHCVLLGYIIIDID